MIRLFSNTASTKKTARVAGRQRHTRRHHRTLRRHNQGHCSHFDLVEKEISFLFTFNYLFIIYIDCILQFGFDLYLLTLFIVFKINYKKRYAVLHCTIKNLQICRDKKKGMLVAFSKKFLCRKQHRQTKNLASSMPALNHKRGLVRHHQL